MEHPGNNFRWQDYLVFVGILGISVLIGVFHGFFGKKNNTSVDYLLGGRQMNWLAVGLSILVTFQSAVLFTGIPTEVYMYGLSFVLFIIGVIISVVICAVLFVPLLYPLKLTSTYEYLERRYDSRAARLVGSMLGTLNMSMFMGIIIFAPATAIESACGLPTWAGILLQGAVAIFYTVLGGLKAVVWNDVFQFVIMMVGILTMVIKGCIMMGGIENIWEINQKGGRIDFSSFDPDPRTRHSVWSLVIGGTIVWLSNIGINQSNVQRMSSVPTLRAAQLAVLITLPGFAIFATLASMLGLIVYAYYASIECDPIKAQTIRNPNQLAALFVSDTFNNMPGFAGLFVAALVAASLSTVSSSINSLAAMAWEDLLKKRFKNVSEKRSTCIIRCLGLLYGGVAVGIALIVSKLGGSATQIVIIFFGASGGPLLGMYLLGCLFPCANWIGVCTGAMTGLVIGLWLAIGGYTIPPVPGLPLASIAGCNPGANNTSNLIFSALPNISNSNPVASSLYSLDTTTVMQALDKNPLEDFYRISYLWYSGIGVCIVIIVGLIVSFITGKTKTEELDPQLVVPFFDNFCCCLPKNFRRRLHFGYNYNSNKIHPESIPDKDPHEKGCELEEVYFEKTGVYGVNGKESEIQELC